MIETTSERLIDNSHEELDTDLIPPTAIIGRSREIAGKDGVALYLDEIAKTPLLNAEGEVEHAMRIEAGLMAEYELAELSQEPDDSQYREELEWLANDGQIAKNEFIAANLRLVVSIARKYGRAQMPMLDMIQEGNTGLIRAVEKFDYTKGYKFSTYATWWVRQAITRGIAQQARMVRLPVHTVEELNQVVRARGSIEKLGREATVNEIAAELDFEEERVKDLLEWSRDHISLNTTVDDNGETELGDLIVTETAPGPESILLDTESHTESSSQLAHFLSFLDEREIDIILSRYGLHDGRTQKLADIGIRHNVSAERVRQLERDAIKKLNLLSEGKELSVKPQRQAAAKELGKRALQRLQLAEQLKTGENLLTEDEREILRAYLQSSSVTNAAKQLETTEGRFRTKYKKAKEKLDTLTVG